MFSESQNGSTCQFITLFPLIHLTQSDRTVLTNLEKSNLFSSYCFILRYFLLSRDDPSVVVSHCHFLSNVVLNDFPAELFLQKLFIVKVNFDSMIYFVLLYSIDSVYLLY